MRILLAICLLSLSLIAQAASRSPEKVLQDFYSWVLSTRKSTLPTPAELKKLTGIISPHLKNLIIEASQAEKRCFESVKASTDKPYYFESDVFIGNWGRANEVAYRNVEPKDGRATVDVTHFSVNPKIAKGAVNRVEMWIIRVKLNFNEGAWQIDDLEYEDGETLTSVISDYLANSKNFCRS